MLVTTRRPADSEYELCTTPGNRFGGGVLNVRIGYIYFIFVIQFFAINSLAQDLTICHRFVVLDPVQEPALIPKCRVEADVFYLEGMITAEMVFELKYLHPQVRVLELNSFGGLVKDTYELAQLIREQKMVTRVRPGARCASACTLLFQAGVKREAHPESKFLYHGARLGSEWLNYWLDFRYQFGRERALNFLAREFTEVELETVKFFGQLMDYGLAPEFIQWYQSQPEDPNWFERGNFTRTQDVILPARDLQKWGVVTDLID